MNEIQSIETVSPKPGDVVLVTVPRDQYQVEGLVSGLAELLDSMEWDNQVIIVPEGFTVQAIPKKDAAELLGFLS